MRLTTAVRRIVFIDLPLVCDLSELPRGQWVFAVGSHEAQQMWESPHAALSMITYRITGVQAVGDWSPPESTAVGQPSQVSGTSRFLCDTRCRGNASGSRCPSGRRRSGRDFPDLMVHMVEGVQPAQRGADPIRTHRRQGRGVATKSAGSAGGGEHDAGSFQLGLNP